MFQVNGKPFIMLAGEAHNSNYSTLLAMQPVWKKARELAMNSVLLPVSWELVEPGEGKFDFSIVDGLIYEARENGLKLGFLWFATWKNAGCSYAPAWVKKDISRFPRVNGSVHGMSYSPLSVHGEETRKADARAFAELCRHIKAIDAGEQTVVYIQVENEAGLMGSARECSDLADELFAGQVPEDFAAYMRSQTTLQGDIKDAVANGKCQRHLGRCIWPGSRGTVPYIPSVKICGFRGRSRQGGVRHPHGGQRLAGPGRRAGGLSHRRAGQQGAGGLEVLRAPYRHPVPGHICAQFCRSL